METLTIQWNCNACDEVHEHVEPDTDQGKSEILDFTMFVLINDGIDVAVYETGDRPRRDITMTVMKTILIVMARGI